ncbi:MAG: hypothetical protein M3Y08_16540 [Fibrobacterota bacterium]|nr:hypothetical protein [Fibrobacterota bacterium]
MDGVIPRLNPVEEISTFCPVRLYLANRRFDGLLDTLDSKGGNFYVLTDNDPPRSGSKERIALQMETRVELAIGSSQKELRILCLVRGMRIDEDGLFAYVGLNFMIGDESVRRRLDDFISALW